MADRYEIHPETPQHRIVEQIVKALRQGAVMLYPTDTVYAIGCDINSKAALQRVRQLKQLSNDKPLTFLCPSLSNVSQYAIVTDTAYRLMRRLVPGPYTFLLPATKLVPKLVMAPKRKTAGIRVPDRPACMALLEALGDPIVSASAHPSSYDEDPAARGDRPLGKAELFDLMQKQVDIIVDDGLDLQHAVSTIVDLTEDPPQIVRQGRGEVSL